MTQSGGDLTDAGTPEVLESPPRRSTPRWVIGAIAAGCGVLVGFTAVYGTGHHRSGASTANGSGPTIVVPSATAGAVSNDPAANTLTRLVVHPADVRSGVSVFVIPGGDQTGAEQPTLDLCNGTYPSEALRTARLQVAASTAGGDNVISTEAVLYRSPAAAAQALSELRTVTARCPHTPVTSPVGEPTATTTFGPAPDAGWPATVGVERRAYDVSSTDDSGHSERSFAVYLRRGRVLLALYLPREAATAEGAVAGRTALRDITAVFSARLAALPASVVAG